MHRRRQTGRARQQRQHASRRAHRRPRRRDTSRGVYYEPLRVAANAAERGVRARLTGAAGAGALTFACVLAMTFGQLSFFAILLLAALAAGALAGAIALVLSARREELVHQLASDLNAEPPELPAQPPMELPLLTTTPRPEAGPRATDGSL